EGATPEKEVAVQEVAISLMQSGFTQREAFGPFQSQDCPVEAVQNNELNRLLASVANKHSTLPLESATEHTVQQWGFPPA
ncbi:unnamed protein product, partial [Amoebophrya sp. A25]